MTHLFTAWRVRELPSRRWIWRWLVTTDQRRPFVLHALLALVFSFRHVLVLSHEYGSNVLQHSLGDKTKNYGAGIGVGTRGLGGHRPPILCCVLRSLQLSKTDIQLIIGVYVIFSILLVDFILTNLLYRTSRMTIAISASKHNYYIAKDSLKGVCFEI